MRSFTPRTSAALALTVLICLIYIHVQIPESLYAATLEPLSWRQAHQRDSLGSQTSITTWKFDAEKDAYDYSLTTEQCDMAFPDLFLEIERALKYWHSQNHIISADDIDISWRKDGAFRLLIHENQVRMVESRILETNLTYGNYSQRTSAVLQQIRRALIGASAAGEAVPTIEFSVVVEDLNHIPSGENDTHTTWHFARRVTDRDQDRIWLIPDFNFWAAPAAEGIVDFSDAREQAKQHDSPLVQKIPKTIWRGVIWTNEAIRGALLKAAANASWADVEEIDWKIRDNMIRTEELCNYMFLLHTEGQSWSGRLKYLLNCDAVAIVHELDWSSHYYHLLVADGPHQNYISVKQDFSNLQEKVHWLLDHPEYAQQVANNALATFRNRYITPAAVACYWRRLFHAWAEVAFLPDPYERIAGSEGLTLRGIAAEDFFKLKFTHPG